MDLKEKLQYYKRSGQGSRGQAKPDETPQIPASVKALIEHFNAELLIGSHAPVIKMQNTFACEYYENPLSLKRLSKRQITEPIDLNDCLFFDLETTGLSGGTGTYPFLLGFGVYEGEQFRIVQYFLPDFGRDYFVFKDLQPLLESKHILISYNGKSYDLPLLKSRAIMNRLNIDFDRMRHLDLLHVARRVWKDSQERCDLNSVEALQLGLNRPSDIPGWQIPQAYLNFLNTGVIHEMIAAIEHNVQDIYSLAKLLRRLAEVERQPQTLNDSAALLRLAYLAYELDDYDYFRQIEQALSQTKEQSSGSFKFLKSKFLKKRNDWPNAVTLWQELAEERAYRFFALQELAKYFEHRAKNYRQALHYCQKALALFAVIEELNPYSPELEMKKDFVKRMDRLRRKLS